MFVDPELQAFAASSSRESRSVIVELPPPQVAPPSRYLSGKAPAQTAKSAASSGQPSYRELERSLKQLGLASDAVGLESVGSIVLDVTPEQLRKVMTLPAVGAIRANRSHRAPGR